MKAAGPDDVWSLPFQWSRLAQSWVALAVGSTNWKRPNRGRGTFRIARRFIRKAVEGLHAAFDALNSELTRYSSGSRWTW